MRIGLFVGLTGPITYAEALSAAQQAEGADLDSFWLPKSSPSTHSPRSPPSAGRPSGSSWAPTSCLSTTPSDGARPAGADHVGAHRRPAEARHRAVTQVHHREDVRLVVRRAEPIMREYLSILQPMLAGEAVHFEGRPRTTGQLAVTRVPIPVLLAAMGPRMLRLADLRPTDAARRAGERRYTTPAIRAAAEAAGRPAPRISTALPICVTDDVDAAHRLATELFAVYKAIPSYRTILDRRARHRRRRRADRQRETGRRTARRPRRRRRHRLRRGRVRRAGRVRPHHVAPPERPAIRRATARSATPVCPRRARAAAVRQHRHRAGRPICATSGAFETIPTDAERTPWRVSGNNVERRRHLPPGGWHRYPPDNCSRQEVGIRHPFDSDRSAYQLTASAAAISSLLPLSRRRSRQPYSASASVITAGDELEPRPSRR